MRISELSPSSSVVLLGKRRLDTRDPYSFVTKGHTITTSRLPYFTTRRDSRSIRDYPHRVSLGESSRVSSTPPVYFDDVTSKGLGRCKEEWTKSIDRDSRLYQFSFINPKGRRDGSMVRVSGVGEGNDRGRSTGHTKTTEGHRTLESDVIRWSCHERSFLGDLG